MALPRLQLRKGTTAPSGAIALVAEPFVDTTNKNFYIADGASSFIHIGGGSYTSRVDEFLTASVASTSVGSITLKDAQASQNSVTLDVPATVTASYSFTLPPNAGTNGYVLQTDGAGNTSWATQTAGYTSWTLSDGTNTQAIESTNTVTVTGGSGIAAAVSATDTLTINLDINELTALDAEGGLDPLVVADSIPVYDASATANKKVTVANLETVIFADVSGDITIAANGVASIAANSVALGTDTTGDYVASVSVTANGGISTSGASTGEGTSHALALDIDGMTDIGAALADADLIAVDDGGAGTNRKAAVTRVADYTFGKVSGDIAIAAGGTASISAGVIVNADISSTAEISVSKLANGTARQLLQTDAAGTGVEWTSNIDIPGTLDVTGKTTLDGDLDVATAVTSGGTVNVATGTTSTGNTKIVNIATNGAAGSTTSVTIGTSAGASSVTILGDLTVTGATTTVNTTNTVVNDSLIELANGTTGTPTSDAGLIIERGDLSNVFVGYDEGADVFVVGTTTATGSSSDTTPTPIAFLAGALNLTDTAGTNESVISYLAANTAYTGQAAGRYLQNINIDLGTY